MKFIIIFLLFLVSSVDLSGQWYYKKYHVTDIDFLTEEQMHESLSKAKIDLLGAGLVAGAGVLGILAGKSTLKRGLGEDATWLEEQLGSQFLGKTYISLGIGMLAGGTAAGIVFLGRIGNIRAAHDRNFKPEGYLKLEPVIIPGSYVHSSCPGMALIFNY